MKEKFFDAISPENLYFASALFGIGTVIVVAAIYIFLYSKKRRYRVKTAVTEQLNDWISEELTDLETGSFVLPEGISVYLRKKYVRQLVTENLINIRKNMMGSVVDNVIRLYEHLGLKEDSVNKMNNPAWHKRARGIYELYMMRQEEYLPRILLLTDNDNEFVRMEAHTAIIGFKGFEGLNFLDTLTRPLTEWQQIKLLEQLETIDTSEMSHLPGWLKSPNRYVVQFALKLVEIYREFGVHDDVLPCLNDENDKTRHRAIGALGSIAGPDTMGILKLQYPKETDINKREILRQIAINGTDEDIDFLMDKLLEDDDKLKLEAARALVAVDRQNINLLQARAADNEIIASITNQVKHETAL